MLAPSLDQVAKVVWFGQTQGHAVHHTLYDTESGQQNVFFSLILIIQKTTEANGLTSFNSNGFTVGSAAAENNNGSEIVSWTFRKAAKFFDVKTVTHTNGSRHCCKFF